ncbi:amino acid adenylation domain-containing protein, partial [Aquimarina sp. EL_43]
DMSMSPLFQVMFTLQNTPEVRDSDLDNIRTSPYNLEETTSQFDLTLNAVEEQGGISLSMTYCTALLDKDTVARMLVHYKELLNSIVKDITLPIHSLSMVTDQEREELLYKFNDTVVAYPQDKSIIDLFKQQVEKTPDAIAIIFENDKLSFKELDDRSNQLAHYLVSQNVKSEELVGICLDRSLEMIIGILGILKSGAAYVPIDPEYPSERIDYILEDATIKILLSSIDRKTLFEKTDTLQVISLDEDWGIISNESNNNINKLSGSECLAYVIYTSGSTGKPKGVMNEHRGVVNRLLWTQSHYNLDARDSILQKTSFCFDVSVWELFWPIISGAKLVFAKPEGHKDARYLRTLIESHNITTIHFVPSMLRAFLSEINLGDCSCLQRVLCSGEALLVDHAMLFREKFNNVRLDNLYGPTEAAIDVSFWEVPAEGDLSRVPIGKPVANTNLYILDKEDQVLPIGVVGELCIGGIQVARGYLNRKELTEERFVADPFIVEDRMYKTGDLARWLSDGTIEYIGRKDDQVKIRGYRIELGEIENVLSTIEGIHSCCVLAKEDGSGGKRLVGYVVGDFDKEKVQKELRSRLPEYMVPLLWVELEEMPLTSNGKLNKKILPDPDTSQLSSQEYVAPRNELETQLVLIWQELLGIDKVGVYDNFFELGGHSLLIVQLISKLHDQNLHIEVKDIFANPTIEALALRLGTVTSHYEVPPNGITIDSNKITPDMVPLLDFSQEELDIVVNHIEGGVSNIQDVYPLSPLQEGMYFHHLLSDRTSGDPYVLITGISFDHPDKRSEFIEAFRYVVTRHDVLRTCIINEGLPNAVQVVLRDVKLKVSELPFSSSQNVKDELESMMASGKHWIDLSKAPLLNLETADDPITDNYYLIMKYHHTVIDHVGLEKIVGEIEVCLSGDKSSLSTPVLYRDFIGHVLYQQSVNDSESYFRSRLGSITEPTFPFGLSDTLGDGSGIEESRYVLPRDLSNQLRSLSRSLGMTPAVLFHAAWGLVIGRCSSKDYAIFGSLFSGRLQGTLEAGQSLGLFINTLPVVLDLSDNVRDYVAKVKMELEGLLPYEQTPLSRIQNWSGVSNDTPLFSALLNYRHSSPAPDHPDTDLEMRLLGEKERTNYPFEVSVDDLGEDFSLTAFVDGDITPVRVIKYMEMALQELIKGLVSENVIGVSSLSILPDTELELLNSFNTTEVSYPLDQTVVDLFSTQVSSTPLAIALSYKGLELTYQELDDRSNQLAHYLQEKGVENGELVGICITRSFEMVIGILAILKSGGAYVPIKPDFPTSRISHIVEDTNCNLILTDCSSLSSLDLLDVTKVIMDGDAPEYVEYPTASPDITTIPDALSYVIYTSGSTGVPKGAMIEHRGLLNHLLLMIDELEMDLSSVVAFTAPFTFDISVWQILSALLCGGRVAIYNEDTILDPQFLEKSLSEDEVSILQLVPSYVSELLDIETPKGLNRLKYFLVTGEAVSRGVLQKWFSQYPNIPVVNAYGPAEAADDVTLHKMYEVPDGSMISIGKPVANMQIHILDAVLNLCPIGVIGEICVSGVGVGRGYINDAIKTASSFISDPFVEGGRMYRTGDLGRWLEDGTIEFVGRADDQVKIRGYRIELGEIENALSGIEGITQCCVLAPDDHNGNKRLVGYVVSLRAFDKALVQDSLSSQLPPYMVPQLWVELEEMPLTGNGKIDKKSLPLLDTSALSGESYVAPRTDMEEQLALIWQDLLGMDKVGVYDNFFELGGHSLLATRLVSKLRKEMSIEVSIRDIFIHGRLEDLGVHLLSRRSGVVLPALEIQQRPDRIPLSFSQERLWFLDQLEGSAAYHIPIVLWVEGSLDIDILETCFRIIVSRHEVLRTMIHSEDGIGYQEVIESDNWKLDRVTDQSDASLETSLMSYLNIPFDLAKDYKFRACIYELESDRYVLAGVFHHIASDAWSEDILVKEFAELYEAYQKNREVTLPELSLQYSDYAIWQRNYVEGEILERQLSYWQDKLQGVAPLALPTDYVRPSVQDYKGSCITLNLNPDLSSAIESLCKQEGVTLFMMLLSAFKVLLYKYSGQSDICVGTSIANRTQSELEGMIGFFVNTLALRSDLGDNPDFKEFLSQVKDTTLHAYDHQLTPFEKVVDRVVDKRDMSINPLFQVMFDMQNTTNETLALEGITLSPYEHEASTSQFDLNLVAEEKESGILLRLEYFTSLFKESTVIRMLSHYEELLKSIVNNSISSIDSLSMLPKQEEELILGRSITPAGLSFNP